MASEWGWGPGESDPFSGTSMAVRCYASHPALKIGTGTLYGGSARYPQPADIYVVLQRGDMDGLGSDPWEEQRVVEVQFAIADMGVPKDVPRFKKLVKWLCNQLQAGKTVHIGCIGGHGRTGTVIAAIKATLGEKDAIQWVRAHYCQKAVESNSQVQFLMQHFGVSTATGAKEAPPRRQEPAGATKSKAPSPQATPRLVGSERLPAGKSVAVVGKVTKTYDPMPSARSLWKPRKQTV